MTISRICRIILALTIVIELATSSRAQNQAAPATNLPPDLALVPSDTSLFVACDFSKYWGGPEIETLNRLANAHPVVVSSWLKEMPAAIGLQPENVVRATTFSDAGSASATILTKTRCDGDKVLSTLAPEFKQKTVAGKTYFFSEKSKNSVYFVDDHTLLIEFGHDLDKVLGRSNLERNASLDIALDATLRGAPFVFNVSQARIRSLVAENNGVTPAPLAQLTQARALQIITAIDKHLTIDLRAEFATKDEAKNAIPALQGIGNSLIGLVPFYKSHMIPFLEEQSSQYPAAKEIAPELTRALDAADQGLRAMRTGTVQNAAVARIEIDSDKPVTTAVMLLTLMPRPAKRP